MILSTVCYLIVDEKMLLLHRNKKESDSHQGKWIGLGGKIELNETPEACIRREFYEESGLTLDKVKLNGRIAYPPSMYDPGWIVYVYTSTSFSGNLTPCDEGTLEWVCVEEYLDKPMWEGDRIFLEWLLEMRPYFESEMVYEGEKLISHTVNFSSWEQVLILNNNFLLKFS